MAGINSDEMIRSASELKQKYEIYLDNFSNDESIDYYRILADIRFLYNIDKWMPEINKQMVKTYFDEVLEHIE